MKHTFFVLGLLFGLSMLLLGTTLSRARQQPPRDGAWITYISEYRDRTSLNRMLFDGGNAEQIEQVASGQFGASTWSPDGRWILLTRLNNEAEMDLYRMRPGGQNYHSIGHTLQNEIYVSWSPDGRWIAFSNSVGQLYLVQPDGEGLQMLSDNGVHPSWSPDGEWIVFNAYQEGNMELYKIRTNGRDKQRLTNASSDEESPSWSPDGQWIAFATDRDGNNEIYVMQPDGTELRRVSNQWPQDQFPTWSPDGAWIVFQSNRHQNWELFRVRPDGRDLERLTHSNADNFWPAFSPFYDLDWHANAQLGLGGLVVILGLAFRRWIGV